VKLTVNRFAVKIKDIYDPHLSLYVKINNGNVKLTDRSTIGLIILMIITSLILSGCTQAPESPTDSVTDSDSQDNKSESRDGDYIYGTAVVESTEILVLESFPVQIHVVAKGYLPDGCTEIDRVEEERNGNTFTVTITTKRPKDMMCTQAIVAYEKVVPLDVYGLKKGMYDVNVNTVADSFELSTDNIIEDSGGVSGVNVFTEYNNGSTVELETGDTFQIKLNENPTTGYQWTVETTGGLEIMSDNYTSSAAPGLVGAGGIHEWDIKATASGTQQVTAVYSRPWENLTGSEQRFVLTVQVK
jgi:inhibitor of cysteine peptidase